MEKFIKDVFYTSIGATSLILDKVQTTFEEVLDGQQTATEEGKKIVDRFLSQTQQRKEEFEAEVKKRTTHFQHSVEEIVDSFRYSSKAELRELIHKLEVLEGKLDDQTNTDWAEKVEQRAEDAKTAAKKTTTRGKSSIQKAENEASDTKNEDKK